MDMEQLTLIIDAVSGLGDKAVWVVSLIVAREYLSLLLGFGLTLTALWVLYKCFAVYMGKYGAMVEAANIMGADTDFYYGSTRKDFVDRVRKLVEKDKAVENLE